jgi:hypothetical protein
MMVDCFFSSASANENEKINNKPHKKHTKKRLATTYLIALPPFKK